MKYEDRFERRRLMAKKAPRHNGKFIREGYPFGLHDWMEHNAVITKGGRA